MMLRSIGWLSLLLQPLSALRFDAKYTDFNLNQNETASNPLDYWGAWPDHEYHPSPKNWRFPFYSFFLDRFVNGDASNDDANGTVYETDVTNTNMRFGGDIQGLLDSLDYIHGMGVRGIYISGSIFINLPWMADSYSPLDLTILDHHFGTLSEWRRAIDEIHRRGMYIILDHTFNTLGDLLEFSETANTSTPFYPSEVQVRYKTDRHYHDFGLSEKYFEKCPWPLPRFWDEDGFPTPASRLHLGPGCFDSEFDQYGSADAFDNDVKVYQRQLTKFSSTQDRLREWNPTVLRKIEHFSCLAIRMLDIDGYRIDKAVQVTVDAQAHFSKTIRDCARRHGKENFFIAGEVVSEMGLASVYFGRGREPDMVPANATIALSLATNRTGDSTFIRKRENSALDGAAFHYGLYRAMVVFLGMDGLMTLPSGSRQFNFVDMWQGQRGYLLTDDMVNPNTGLFDPRHMWGVSNQDLFRWSGITNGRHKMLLGFFITTFHFPGIPLLSWGDEQAFYVLDSTAENYLFGRQPMASSIAWQMHGCYQLDSSAYYRMPLALARTGCYDDEVSLDHRDPSHPIRNVLKIMNKRREQYPTLNDGWFLEQLSNQTRHEILSGSGGAPTEFGLWSTVRDEFAPFQNLSATQDSNEPLWLVYHNEANHISYSQGCIASPFDHGTQVKNILFPYEEYTVVQFRNNEILRGSKRAKGCVRQMELRPFEFKALVTKKSWVPPPPVITQFLPGHDARIETKTGPGESDVLDVSFSFSAQMDCTRLTAAMVLSSQTDNGIVPHIRTGSVQCIDEPGDAIPEHVGQPVSVFTWMAALENVFPGIHTITVRNATTKDGLQFTDSNDTFLFRVGAQNNPMVFPQRAMFPKDFLSRHSDNGSLEVKLYAPGANKWRYSLNWGASWSSWKIYTSGYHVLDPQEQKPWAGTASQEWRGEHIMVQYWSKIAGSSGFMQHADIESVDAEPRLFPHLFAHGDFNLHGHDRSMASKVEFDGEWRFHFMGEWPDGFSLNVWGMNADGKQDLSFVYGDVDHNNILDRWIPSMLSKVTIPFDHPPPYPYLAYEFALQRDSYRYELRPRGNRWHQILLFLIFGLLPPASGIIGLRIYQNHYCRIISNRYGSDGSSDNPKHTSSRALLNESHSHTEKRCILIATVEYNIPDWNIDIRLGGLGTMSTVMGKHLTEYNLIWVVPCVKDIHYPFPRPEKPFSAYVCGREFVVQVYYHTHKNVTYVILDSPIFRSQTKAQPYPIRMDDMRSAIYYSVWNSCIAEAIKRFSPDVYHINDYHGALAPLHLLPRTIPCVLSLHNAEYQGLWAIRTPEEEGQVCAVFDISTQTMKEYVQFGAVFNLLHAAATYIRIHQNGCGVVGVSDVYSERCMARYPILWSLSAVGSLPNPDPSQLDHVQEEISQRHGAKTTLKSQTQEWAGLEADPSAELFIFVGRMSKQKGIDLIADVFPQILQHNSKVQLLCIGPVVDLYGKFTTLKLEKVAAQFPRRVCCIPRFTQLPPFIFGGADFVLIPSRDEPYGLVAAQFGREGALAVGAKVGGLGNVPGWWYPVECTTTRHLLAQLRSTILLALQSSGEVREQMRAAALRQSFPISLWKARLETLYHEVSANQQATKTSQWTSQPKTLMFRNIKNALLSKRGFGLTHYLDNAGTTTLHDKFSAKEMRRSGIETAASMADFLGNNSHCLNNVADPFTDYGGEFSATFTNMLDRLTPENSENSLCIEDFLIASERLWFERIRNARFGLPTTRVSLVQWVKTTFWAPKHNGSSRVYTAIKARDSNDLERGHPDVQTHCDDNTFAVTKLQKFWAMKFHDYPLYTFALMLGQILSMNSLQLGILVGTVSQDEGTLYTVGTIYAASSVLWWVLHQRLQTVHVICLPFLLFGCSFVLLAAIILCKPTAPVSEGRLWQLVQVLYVGGSSSGSLYFAMNFLEDESAPIESWIQRAAYISGFQYGYQALLWYSASRILRTIASTGQASSPGHHLLYGFGAVIFLIGLGLIFVYISLRAGLPSPYRRIPGHIPKFYSSLLRRPISMHYLVSTFVQSFSLSAPLMAQSWLFLFSSHAPDLVIGLLVVAAILSFMHLARKGADYSVQHGHWILPVVSFTASSIVHPRWAQIFWSVSRIGLSLPWVHIPRYLDYQLQMVYSPFFSAVLGRSLWLCLGVFDLLVGIGNGLALMQTLPRQHILFVSMLAQVFGAAGMMIARATILAPEDGLAGLVEGLKMVPLVFPDISKDTIANWLFCGVFILQIGVAMGWMRWFRGAQLQKP